MLFQNHKREQSQHGKCLFLENGQHQHEPQWAHAWRGKNYMQDSCKPQPVQHLLWRWLREIGRGSSVGIRRLAGAVFLYAQLPLTLARLSLFLYVSEQVLHETAVICRSPAYKFFPAVLRVHLRKLVLCLTLGSLTASLTHACYWEAYATKGYCTR